MDSILNLFTSVIGWFKSFDRTTIMIITAAFVFLGIIVNIYWNSRNFQLAKKHKDEERENREKDREELKKKSFTDELRAHIKSVHQLEDFCKIETSITITQFSDPNKKLSEDVALHIQNMNEIKEFFAEYDEDSCHYPEKAKAYLESYKMLIIDYLMHKKSQNPEASLKSYRGATILGNANSKLDEIKKVLFDIKKLLEKMKAFS